MDVVDNQHYITKWVEDNLINKVKDTILERNITEGEVDDIIQDGVKETSSNVMLFQSMKVEDTIQNGVKETITSEKRSRLTAENIIENGVRHTEIGWHQCNNIDDAIEKGVKETMFNQGHKQLTVKNIIENGVKETNKSLRIDGSLVIEDTIENGVKKTGPIQHKYMVEDIIENGIKETKTPGNGDIASTDEWMKENNSTSYPKMIDDVIENGVKEIRPSGCVDPKTGIFHYRIQEQVDDVVDNGVKEIKTPNKDGDIKSTLEWMYKNNYQDDYNGSKMINNVIENGVKETQPLPDQSGELIGYGNYYHGKEDRTKPFIDYLEDTIKFGIKN
jgi:hypothetical protein